MGEKLQAELVGGHVVKAFNTLPMEVFEVDPAELARRQVSVFVASDDEGAKTMVRGLAEALSFTAIDAGPLRNARMLEGVADLVRNLIGLGGTAFSAISWVQLPAPAVLRLGGRAPSKLR